MDGYKNWSFERIMAGVETDICHEVESRHQELQQLEVELKTLRAAMKVFRWVVN